MAKDPIGAALGAFLSGVIFIPLGAVLHIVSQSVATGLILSLLPDFFAFITLGHVEDLTVEGFLKVLDWVFGLVVGVNIFSLNVAFGVLSVVLSLTVVPCKMSKPRETEERSA